MNVVLYSARYHDVYIAVIYRTFLFRDHGNNPVTPSQGNLDELLGQIYKKPLRIRASRRQTYLTLTTQYLLMALRL